MRRYNVVLKNEKIIYNQEAITYEKLCKVLKRDKWVRLIILEQYIFIREICEIKREKIEKYIKENIEVSVNEDYLLDYKIQKKEKKTYIYGIKANKKSLEIIDYYKNIKVIPIQMLVKTTRDKFNYEIIYEGDKFYASGEGERFLSFKRAEGTLERHRLRIYKNKIEGRGKF